MSTTTVNGGGTPVIGAGSSSAAAAATTPPTLATRHDVVFCFDGDSTTAGVPAAGTSPVHTFFANTPLGKAWGVGANGQSNIINFAIAGQQISQIGARYSTCGHTVRPGLVINGALITRAYWICWSYWNNEGGGSAGFNNWYAQRQINAAAKADGFTIVNATSMTDTSEAQDGITEAQRIIFNRLMRQSRYADMSGVPPAGMTGWGDPGTVGCDLLADYDALIPDLTAGSLGTYSYTPLLGTDSRHPGDRAAQRCMIYLGDLITTGVCMLPKEVVSNFRKPRTFSNSYIAAGTANTGTPQPPVASADTIVLDGFCHITGTVPVNTLAVNAGLVSTPTQGPGMFITDSPLTLGGGPGNIATPMTTVANQLVTYAYDFPSGKMFLK